jgi:hypothetical protein
MLDNLSETKSFMNGLEWSPKVLAIQNKDFPYIDLRLDIFDNDNKVKESLSIINIPKRTGKLDISSTEFTEGYSIICLYTTFSKNGEELNALYMLDESSDNYITLEEIDNKNDMVSGSFEIHLVAGENVIKHLTNGTMKTDLLYAKGSFNTHLNLY